MLCGWIDSRHSPLLRNELSAIPVTWSSSGLVATSLIARFMGPAWGPPMADRTQVSLILAPWTLLSWLISIEPPLKADVTKSRFVDFPVKEISVFATVYARSVESHSYLGRGGGYQIRLWYDTHINRVPIILKSEETEKNWFSNQYHQCILLICCSYNCKNNISLFSAR